MSFFPDVHDTPIHIQDSTLIAVRGDQNNLSSTSVAGPQQIQVAGNQNNYFASPLKSTSSPVYSTSA